MKTKEITLKLKFNRHQAAALLAVFFLAWHQAFLGSETLTLTTYYPAPYGGYVSLLTTQQTLLARDAGRVGIGTANPVDKLGIAGGGIDVAGGGIMIDGGQTIQSRGRMHLFGQELLYLLNRSGVVIGREWGGNGNLSVQGTLSGLCTWRAMGGGGWSYCAAGENLVNTNFTSWTSEWTCIGRGLANSPTATMCAQGFKTTGVSGSMLCCRIQ